eukprot:Protomagalhaensia_sp_Gyna_25__5400@NODE_69_length_5656_cov_114_358910_g51_i0_p3_GENE_NODE_69_length_5656_cov_114_358910_g51_i0NODE_69_length_5656_cov_114_358910_g51_i0_p3_ORF_typecomplete_len319_score32_74Fbox/PF00646_33/0_072_NODE_69_length_5656_cov_114_358910_g51_i032954251
MERINSQQMAMCPLDCLQQILPFLNAAERFRFGQLCQLARSMVYSSKLETNAMMEYLRRGAPLLPIQGRPFTDVPVDSRLKKLRARASKAALLSWHAVMARLECQGWQRFGFISGALKVSELFDKFAAVRNDQLIIPFDKLGTGVPPTIVRAVATGNSVYTETEAWDLVRRILAAELDDYRGGVRYPVAAAVALLKFYPRYRELCLRQPGVLEEWINESTLDKICVPKSEALQKLGPFSHLTFNEFHSWEFVRSDGVIWSKELRSPQECDEHCRFAYSKWVRECVQAIRAVVKKEGFYPYVDSCDGVDLTADYPNRTE